MSESYFFQVVEFPDSLSLYSQNKVYQRIFSGDTNLLLVSLNPFPAKLSRLRDLELALTDFCRADLCIVVVIILTITVVNDY